MITVQQNRRDFAYDIHSLIRAFYPGVDVAVYQTGEEEPGDYEKKLEVTYSDDAILLVWRTAEGKILGRQERAFSPKTGRAEIKNILKAMLYEILSEETGRKLPWGNLTGIRPVKIPMSLLEQGWKNTQIAEYMRNTYYTSNEKTALAISIANRERAILKDIDYENGYSLYVGIPFCPSVCLYCSFSSGSIAAWENYVDAYLDALCKEIEACAAWSKKKLQTLYIGGGTPTTLDAAQLSRLLQKLEQCFDCGHLREFTVEAGRPDSITREKLAVLKEHPVTRISINPQTMNDQTLEIIGRRHTVRQVTDAFALAREMGFDNINMDLIVGLPGEGYAEVEHTMREVTRLNPDSITVHSLALKRATRLNLFRDEYRETSFVNSSEIMDMTAGYAASVQQFPYYLYRQKNMAGNFENVGYARAGAEGIYNILIMEEKQSILALGAGASTKIVNGEKIERVENVKDIRGYIERIDEMIARKLKAMEMS